MMGYTFENLLHLKCLNEILVTTTYPYDILLRGNGTTSEARREHITEMRLELSERHTV